MLGRPWSILGGPRVGRQDQFDETGSSVCRSCSRTITLAAWEVAGQSTDRRVSTASVGVDARGSPVSAASRPPGVTRQVLERGGGQRPGLARSGRYLGSWGAGGPPSSVGPTRSVEGRGTRFPPLRRWAARAVWG